MKNEQTIFRRFRPALRFLLIFVGAYLIGNIFYGLFIEYYRPGPDPLTVWVSQQTAFIIGVLGDEVATVVSDDAPYILIVQGGKTILRVFEGCNGLNVMIVFGAFLLAFGGPASHRIVFFLAGCVVLHIANLLRVLLLFYTAIHRPIFFYYFHKYFFTAALYAIVFALWFLWIHFKSKTRESAQA